MPDSTPPLPQSPADAPNTSPPKRRRWLLWGCGGLLAFVLILVATVAITIWWIQRPIKPVVLSAEEKKVVETKLEKMRSAPPAGRDEKSPLAPLENTAPDAARGRTYEPGGKELRLTEHELNGLLNENTDLGQTVRLELDRDAINAYLAVPIPKDFPVGGGRMFRARGRFRLSLSQGQPPVAMLEDVSVLGLSLPREWLGGIKGKNLLADAVGERGQAATWKGIKSLRIVPGAIVLEVGD
jgi:hypothetical protein